MPQNSSKYYGIMLVKNVPIVTWYPAQTENLSKHSFGKFCYQLQMFKQYKSMQFTLFDWCKVLEKAKKIHTVNTSIN